MPGSNITYYEQTPSSILKRYVEKLWYCRSSYYTTKVLTIPLLHHELVFNFSSGYSMQQLKTGNTILNPVCWISGLQSQSVISKWEGKHEMIGVLFSFDGLKTFTGIKSVAFTDSIIDAALVFGTSLRDLTYEINQASNLQLKFVLIEQFLKERLKKMHYPESLARYIDFISSRREKVLIKDACKKCYTTNKTLISAFQNITGVTPNKFLQLRAINTAVRLLSANPELSLTSLAHELCFYDQSHFTHSFKRVTGIPPRQFVMAVKKQKVDASAANFLILEG